MKQNYLSLRTMNVFAVDLTALGVTETTSTNGGFVPQELTEDTVFENNLPVVNIEFEVGDKFYVEPHGRNFLYQTDEGAVVITSESWYENIANNVRAFEETGRVI